MQKCAQQIMGTHGFRSFCKVETDIHNHRCSVQTSQWIQKDRLLIYEISANRFLHGMVRTLVGTMVNVGREHTKYEEFQKILESNDRSFAGMSAPFWCKVRLVAWPALSVTKMIWASTTLEKYSRSPSGKIWALGWPVAWVISLSPSRVTVRMNFGASS